MKTLSNMEYKEKKPLLSTLALLGTAVALSSAPNVYAQTDMTDFYAGWAHGVVLQTSQDNFGNYDSGKMTTQIEHVIHYDQDEFLSYLLKEEMIEKISSMFGYEILEIHESSLIDDEGTFKIYTMLLDLDTRDYSILLEQEWEVSESLGLYDKNIILRFL